MEDPVKNDNDEVKYLKAQRRVREIRAFYNTIVTYVLVNILLVIINLITDRHHLWFYWVTLIWGFALIWQGFKIFAFGGTFLGKEWEERQVRNIMSKQDKTNNDELNKK